ISGGIEAGETLEEAAQRECEEEIGITPSNLHYLGRSKLSACFYTYLSDAEVQRLVLGEGQEIRFFVPSEMQGLTMTPSLEDLVTIHLESLRRLMRHEEAVAEDFGLVK
ncbi:MAG: hypothetical protein JWL75_762, partial [Parcubacteria group bacterium]|nr:hypothetical protein [Parcubacteria group bacterium]